MNTMPSLFESAVSRWGKEPALIDPTSSLGYFELNTRVNRLARVLITFGVGPDSLVAIAMPKSNELIMAMLAVLKAGGAYLPLDPTYPAERLSFMLSDARPALLLRSSSVTLPDSNLNEIVVDDPAFIAMCERMPSQNVAQDERLGELHPEHLMYVIYTSGSTGTPKGVAVPHDGVRDMLATQATVLNVGPGDRVLQWASISFDAAFWDVTLALLSGAVLVLAPSEDLLPGKPLWTTLRNYDVTHAVLPPVALSETDSEGILNGGTVMSTGDSCTPTLVRKWSRRRRLFNGYGPTEVTVGATIGGPVRDASNVRIGTPWIGNEVHVLDEHLRPVPPGADGELYIAGSGLARGYLSQFPVTATKFVANPFGPAGSRMYRTGDRGRRAQDGELLFAGRMDSQVKLRGFRVELGEIETRLAAHPAVEVAVSLVRGELADAHIVAYVTTTAPVRPNDLRAYVSDSLPAHMVPTRITVLDRLPTLANGKVDRAALSQRAEEENGPREKVPGKSASEQEQGCATEICEIVREILGVTRVDVTDNFFQLGGHSLQATRMVVRIREQFAIALPIRTVLEAASIGELAAAVESRRPGDNSSRR